MAGPNDLFDLGDDDSEHTAVVKLDDLRAVQSELPNQHVLVRIKGSQTGQVVTLHGAEWRVGRHRTSELWLADGGISRAHARFFWDQDCYVLEDLASANGTYVNGRRITQHRLRDGEIVQFGPTAVFRYSKTDAQQAAMLQQLYTTSVTDSLTGAFNREHFDSRLETELSYARRHGTGLSLIMVDVDHFKKVNDSYGHPAGDAVLQQLSRSVHASMRAEDLFARYGGEEFVVLLRGIDADGAAAVAERLRELVEQMVVRHGPLQLKVTASLGCAAVSECAQPTPDALIELADRRLYVAKRTGRNKVVATGPVETPSGAPRSGE